METATKNTKPAPALTAAAGSEYHIESVEDFLKVPEDRISDCLEEFADFIELSRSMLMIAKNMADILGVEDNSRIGAYTWIDDGKKERSICLVPNDQEEA